MYVEFRIVLLAQVHPMDIPKPAPADVLFYTQRRTAGSRSWPCAWQVRPFSTKWRWIRTAGWLRKPSH
ncbi:hypothetical protein V5799_022504 [Amblyomma americanum]|uniref:Uncharacterized protein n=1 Tax=Amblyomma americanum TaxID=6943 RepID=A0AAQ4FLV3_AMBAM